MSNLFGKLSQQLEINRIHRESANLSEDQLAEVERQVIFNDANDKVAELLQFRGSDGTSAE